MEWQPIETAPKDGSRFLAWCSDDNHIKPFCVVAFWMSDNHTKDSGCDAFFAADTSVRGIRDRSMNGGLNMMHWMPLPEPPK